MGVSVSAAVVEEEALLERERLLETVVPPQPDPERGEMESECILELSIPYSIY